VVINSSRSAWTSCGKHEVRGDAARDSNDHLSPIDIANDLANGKLGSGRDSNTGGAPKAKPSSQGKNHYNFKPKPARKPPSDDQKRRYVECRKILYDPNPAAPTRGKQLVWGPGNSGTEVCEQLLDDASKTLEDVGVGQMG
jgi:hypothetical protein